LVDAGFQFVNSQIHNALKVRDGGGTGIADSIEPVECSAQVLQLVKRG